MLIPKELAQDGDGANAFVPMFTQDASTKHRICQEQLFYWVVLFESDKTFQAMPTAEQNRGSGATRGAKATTIDRSFRLEAASLQA